MYPELLRYFKSAYSRIILNPWVLIIRRFKEVQYKLDMLMHPEKMNYYCPCCKTRIRTFISGDYTVHPELYNPFRYKNTKQEVLCPICRSMPRHRILAAWCDESKFYLQNKKILYFAPERCMIRWMKRNEVSCVTADIVARSDLKINIQETGLPDNSYDLIIANHVLEHVGNFISAIEEVYRILRPNGSFICSFPIDPSIELIDEEELPLSVEERLRRFGHSDHRRVFGMKADQFFTDAGFAVNMIRGEDYPDEILPVVGPADYDINILFCCKKGMA